MGAFQFPNIIDSAIFTAVGGSPPGSDATLDTSAETLTITGMGTVIPLRNLIGKPTKYTYSAGVATIKSVALSTNPTAGDIYKLTIAPVYRQPSLIRAKDSISFLVAANSTATTAALGTQFELAIQSAIDKGQVNGLISDVSGTSTLLITSASVEWDLQITWQGPSSGGTTVAVTDNVAWTPAVGTYAQVVKWNTNAVSSTTYSYVIIPFRLLQPGIGTDGLENESTVAVAVFVPSTDADSGNFLDYIVSISTQV